MNFAIPVTDPTAIRCRAIIDRLVTYPVGNTHHDNALYEGANWLTNAEGVRHPHPFIAFEGDAVIRALVDQPRHQAWLAVGCEWVESFDRAKRFQQRSMNLPECRNTADLIAANID